MRIIARYIDFRNPKAEQNDKNGYYDYSGGPGLDLYALNLGEDILTVLVIMIKEQLGMCTKISDTRCK